ncbi:MAG: hypothetical protein NZ893_03430 [Candidatus Aenigmarchaeota archaeon]|nr:hypothetical protein [Candidatus Aenigmarchaeota archaeon]
MTKLKVEILKTLKYREKIHKKGSIIDIPVSVFHKLSLKGVVKPYIPDVSEEELPYLKREFERLFEEHLKRLKQIPVTISEIKERYPERYKKLRELEAKMDEAWLTFDYLAFTEALAEIEKTIQEVKNEMQMACRQGNSTSK